MSDLIAVFVYTLVCVNICGDFKFSNPLKYGMVKKKSEFFYDAGIYDPRWAH